MESTRETAEMAAAPTLLTIMESAVPIKAVKICSQIRGRIRAARALLSYSLGVLDAPLVSRAGVCLAVIWYPLFKKTAYSIEQISKKRNTRIYRR